MKRSACRAVLSSFVWMLVWAVPARAVTFTDSWNGGYQESIFSYTPASDGILSLAFRFIAEPNYPDEDFTGYQMRAEGSICGAEFGCRYLRSPPGTFINCFSPQQFCIDGQADDFAFLNAGDPLSIIVSILAAPHPLKSFSGGFTFVGPDPVPIPAALPLFACAIGATGLLGWYRRRRSIIRQ